MKLLTQQEAFQALLSGEELQCRHPDGDDWVKVKDANLLLDKSLGFCIAPKVIVANGIEIPMGYQGKMAKGQVYFLPNPRGLDYYGSTIWHDSDYDNVMMKRGLVFLTRRGAITYAKAVISIGGGDADEAERYIP